MENPYGFTSLKGCVSEMEISFVLGSIHLLWIALVGVFLVTVVLLFVGFALMHDDRKETLGGILFVLGALGLLVSCVLLGLIVFAYIQAGTWWFAILPAIFLGLIVWRAIPRRY